MSVWWVVDAVRRRLGVVRRRSKGLGGGGEVKIERQHQRKMEK
jgi:hypothetical protein